MIPDAEAYAEMDDLLYRFRALERVLKVRGPDAVLARARKVLLTSRA